MSDPARPPESARLRLPKCMSGPISIRRKPTFVHASAETSTIDRAYKAILRHAAEVTADLIVMGSQGAGGVELMLYGSNTRHVVRASTCAVLTVRA